MQKYISIVSFDRDTGYLKIETSLIDKEKALSRGERFLNATSESREWTHPSDLRNYEGVAARITIDARSGNGTENTVVNLYAGRADGFGLEPLNAERVISATYSAETGRELKRDSLAPSSNDKYGKKLRFNDGQEANISPERDLEAYPRESARFAPTVPAKDVSALLQALIEHGREIEHKRVDWRALSSGNYSYQEFGQAAQEVYGVNEDGMLRSVTIYEAQDEHFPLHRVSDAWHEIAMFVPTEGLFRKFPFLKDITPTGPDNETAARPGIKVVTASTCEA